MNVNENRKIVYLAGPSSSGKTTSTRLLEEKGWMRIEADAERPQIDIRYLKKGLLEKIAYIGSHLIEANDANIMDVLQGKPPEITPTDYKQFQTVRKELMDFLGENRKEIGVALLIHMLDKAIEINKQGKDVIIRHLA